MFCKTIATFKKYLPTVISSEYSKYEAEIADANRWLKREIMGSALFEATEAEAFSDTELISVCDAVVARKAYMEGIPGFDLVETSAGFVVTRNENQAPASPDRVKKLQESIAKRLTESIENLLEYLENHSEYHDEWKGSPVYALITDIYIHSLTEFRRYAPWAGSRMDWIAAKPKMLNVIKLSIQTVISEELSDEIIEQLRDGDLTESNKSILDNLKFAFANFTIGQSESGNSYLYWIRKKLMASPSSFPAWENSALYATIQASTIDKYNTERPFFRAGF